MDKLNWPEMMNRFNPYCYDYLSSLLISFSIKSKSGKVTPILSIQDTFIFALTDHFPMQLLFQPEEFQTRYMFSHKVSVSINF